MEKIKIQMKKITGQKGVATLFVLVSGLFFISFIMGVFSLTSAKRQIQATLTTQANSIYSNSNTEEINNMKNIVPIYSAEQLLKMGTNQEVVIEEEENRKYLFSKEAQYVLCNDISLEYNGVLDLSMYNFNKSKYKVTITKIATSNTSEVKYYYMKDYNYPVTEEGIKFSGLVLQYDASDNTGNRFTKNETNENQYNSKTTNIWKDLSGNGHDGTLVNFEYTSTSGWTDDSLNFDRALSNYVAIPSNPVYSTDATSEYAIHFVIQTNSTANQGLFINKSVSTAGKGRGVSIVSKKIRFDNGGTIWSTSKYTIPTNVILDICVVRTSTALSLYIDGEQIETTTKVGTIDGLHQYISTIGTFQYQSSSTAALTNFSSFFSGKMYAVNIYNTALTEEEIFNNYYAIQQKLAKKLEPIPIYTIEQLKKIGTGEKINIDGKDYVLYEQTQYIIKNNIETNSFGFLKFGKYQDKNLEDFNIDFNNKTIKMKDISSKINTVYWYKPDNDYAYPIIEEGYVTDGLILRYDAINNTGHGHDATSTIWKDLTWNSDDKDGKLSGFGYTETSGWLDNCLILDGSNDGVSLGSKVKTIFQSNNTIEILVQFDQLAARDIIIGNHNTSNSINYEKNTDNQTRIWFNNAQRGKSSANLTSTTDKYLMTFVIDTATDTLTFYLNGKEDYSITNTVFGKYTYNWTSGWIGKDTREGSTALKGKIYAVRIYTKALTAEEIATNYNLDNQKY